MGGGRGKRGKEGGALPEVLGAFVSFVKGRAVCVLGGGGCWGRVDLHCSLLGVGAGGLLGTHNGLRNRMEEANKRKVKIE